MAGVTEERSADSAMKKNLEDRSQTMVTQNDAQIVGSGDTKRKTVTRMVEENMKRRGRCREVVCGGHLSMTRLIIGTLRITLDLTDQPEKIHQYLEKILVSVSLDQDAVEHEAWYINRSFTLR